MKYASFIVAKCSPVVDEDEIEWRHSVDNEISSLSPSHLAWEMAIVNKRFGLSFQIYRLIRDREIKILLSHGPIRFG